MSLTSLVTNSRMALNSYYKHVLILVLLFVFLHATAGTSTPHSIVPSPQDSDDIHEDSPSTVLTVSRTGFNEALKATMIPHFCELVLEHGFPDYHDKLNVPIVGDVHLDLTHMDVHRISIGSMSMENDDQTINAFVVHFSDLDIDLSDKWHYRKAHFPHIEGHGDSDVRITNASGSVRVVLLTNPEGKSYLWISNPSSDFKFSFEHIDVKIDGGISGALTNVFAKLFANLIKSLIEDNIRDAIVKNINNDLADTLLSSSFKYPVQLHIFGDKPVNFNLKLSDHASFFDQYALFKVIGDWSVTGDPPVISPFSPSKLPEKPQYDQSMLNMFLSDFIVTDFFYTAIKSNLTRWKITSDMVPEASPYQLNTKSLKYIFPKLHETYEDNDLIIDIHLKDTPSFTFSKDSGVSAAMNASLNFHVILNNGTVRPAFNIRTLVTSSIPSFDLKNIDNGKKLNVTGEIGKLAVSIEVDTSWIEEIDVGYAQHQLQIILQFVLIPQWNDMLQSGVEFDLRKFRTGYGQLEMSDTNFSFEDGYVTLASSVNLDKTKHSFTMSRTERLQRRIRRIEAQLSREYQRLFESQEHVDIPVSA